MKGHIDRAKALSSLKDFQRKTVEYVFKRLYLDSPPAKRFLVADEVGLGKTLVARGIIAKAIEHLSPTKKRVDIIYICSNSIIAVQNLARLRVLGMKNIELPTRVTLLPKQLKGLSSRGVNLLSLTPGTSFDMKNSSGIAEERIMLHRLLVREPWVDSKGLKKLLRCSVSRKNWIEMIKRPRVKMDRSIASQFLAKVKEDHEFVEHVSSVTSVFRSLRKRNPPKELQDKALKIVAGLRRRMAQICIQSLKPDLVILDEFQRFRELLHGDGADAQLANILFDYSDAKVILLSATPYKMLTLDHEYDEDHYLGFMEMLRFLFEDPGQVDLVKADLMELRRQLFSSNPVGQEQVFDVREKLETRLKKVMCRTERVSATADRGAMLKELHTEARLTANDLRDAALTAKIATAVGSYDTVEYWKSSPYILSFSRKYDLRRKLDASLGNNRSDVLSSLQDCRTHMLQRSHLRKYRRIDPGSARMRGLFTEVLDTGLWRLLWMPPSMPYMRPGGPFANIKDASKYLIFSCWNIVPDAIAALCSYEAERRMLGGLRRSEGSITRTP